MVSQEKIDHSIGVLRLAAKMSEQYYKQPLIIAYSGGKDSDVLLQLAIDSGITFEVEHQHTTVDAPETVYHIRDVFAELNAKGIHAVVNKAHYDDGTPKTMWNLIPRKKMPPTRLARYCCQHFKEHTTPNRFVALGVRASESIKRRDRGDFSYKGEVTLQKTLQETEEVYREAQENDEVYDCRYITLAKQNKSLICNAIYHWTDEDVWSFIKARGIKYNPLYDRGYKRVGCIGCPMSGRKQMIKEFNEYPTYKQAYIRAFDKLQDFKFDGDPGEGSIGERIFKWWIQDPTYYGQTTLDEWDDDGR